MKRRLVSIALAGILLMGVTPAFAAAAPANGGAAFGSGTATMAPDCSKTMGADFGNHLSIMAKGGDCGCAK